MSITRYNTPVSPILMWSSQRSQKPDESFINRFQRLYRSSFSHMESKRKQSNQLSTDDRDMRINDCQSSENFSFDHCDPLIRTSPSCELPWPGSQIQNSDTSRSQSGASEISSGDSVERKSSRSSWSSSSQSFTRPLSDCAPNGAAPQLWNNINPFGTNGCLPTQFTHDISDHASMNLVNPATLNAAIQVSPRLGIEKGFNHPSVFRGSSHMEEFSFETVLRAPTAIIETPDQVPVSYLNKGQVYHIAIMDCLTPAAPCKTMNFRTFIRISFEREHRRDSASRWQLWKDGRESSGSYKRDLPPMAVQYTGQTDQIRVEQANLDGFSILWSTSATGANQCTIPVRFNFLSTDFTLAKGVKGDSVRLCVKNERIGDPFANRPEVSFCHVKLFRDHGAERKMSNDAAIIRRRMEKLKRQAKHPHLDKTSKNRRIDWTHSESFQHSNDPREHLGASSLQSQFNTLSQAQLRILQKKLDVLQWTLQSSKPATVFNLRADHHDDPDLHPQIPIDKSKIQPHDPLHGSLPVLGDGASRKSRKIDHSESAISLKNQGHSEQMSESDQLAPAVACFYIRLRKNDTLSGKHYRAVYPKERTAVELKRIISESDPTILVDTSNMFYINRAGLKVVADDNFVQHIAEGQDMVVETRDSVDHLDSIQCPTPSKDIYLIY